MKKLLLIVITIALTGMFSVNAQDYQLSMFTSSPLALNPASTGFHQNGAWRLHLNHREQWGSFLDKSINTSSFSFDMPMPSSKIGLGLLVLDNSKAKGGLRDLTAALSVGYTTRLSRRSGHYLSFGLQAGIKQKSFKLEDLTFENQYVPGVGFVQDKSSGESFPNTSMIYPDFSFGALWYLKDKLIKSRPWIGFAAYHLAEPNESFYGNESVLPRKYVINGGADIYISEKVGLTPMVLFASQGDHIQYNPGLTFNFSQNEATTFKLGGYYRSNDALVCMVGLVFADFTILFDYEVNTSDLKSVSDGNGGFNVTLRYIRVEDKHYNVKFL